MTEQKLYPAEAQALADATAEAMYSRDRAAQALGIRIVRVQPGASLLPWSSVATWSTAITSATAA